MLKNKEIDKFYKTYQSFLSASDSHNIEACHSSINYLEEQENIFWNNVLEFIENAKNETTSVKELYSDSTKYTQQLFDALITKNIPVDMEEDVITLGPISLEIKLEEYSINLIIGRKKRKISELEISRVVKAVEQTYKKINSSFNVNAFANKLIKAYEYVNKALYGSNKTQFGNAVPLEELFKIFTISPSSSDYKIENFLWDLGRMISNSPTNAGYQFEFGFSRNIGRMMIIKDTDGIIHKYSTLTVYKG